MKREQKKLLLEEGGKFFIDITKYIITGVIITVLLTDLGDRHTTIYVAGCSFATFFGFIGFYLLKRKED